MRLGETTLPANPVQTAAAQQSVTDQIIDAVGKIVPLWQQQRIFSAQLSIEKQRAKQSGGSLDINNLTPPGIPVSMGIDSNTKLLIGGGIALLAVILLMNRKGR